jgi:transcriptional regulator with XRE-family HTH domain
MGRLIRAYRLHPHHGRRGLSQQRVAEWAGITQAQLSRIESGPAILHLDRLGQWACLLDVPQQHLWFYLPREAVNDEDDVKRAEFLRLGVAVAATAVVGMPRMLDNEQIAQSLAWELWQLGRSSLHPSELPREVAAALPHVIGGASCVVCDPNGCYMLAHPSLVDFFVAQRIFGGIARQDPSLFASAQTSHDTDQVLRRFVAQDSAHMGVLTSWMRDATDPVLRVNSAGVLGKVGDHEAVAVIDYLRRDIETRQRYVTAVASRVLDLDWQVAAEVATDVERCGTATRWTPGETVMIGQRLAGEVVNPRDGAARWCSLVLLGHLGTGHQQEQSLQHALRSEPVPENLRAIGSVLAGSSPLTI